MKRSFEYDKENLNRKGRMPVLTSKKQVRKRKQRKIRNSEYYDMEKIFDDLYAQGKTDKVFNHLMEIIESEENIKLAYRNIKRNSGSSTAGVDHRTIDNLANLILVSKDIHTVIHASTDETIRKYLTILKLDAKQLTKLNKLRTMAEMPQIIL